MLAVRGAERRLMPVQEPGRLATAEELIEEARNGRMFILLDEEGSSGCGNLVIPAQMATPDAVNFMATHGRGLVCLALTRRRMGELGLQPVEGGTSGRSGVAFATSIEAAHDITTGISAADRACTIAAAINGLSGPEAIATPGHVFPLTARDGGVLARAGHTEAAVDIARLAGLNASAVICEMLGNAGSVSRQDELAAFAERHRMKIGTISSLIAYRRKHDRMIKRIGERDLKSEFGGQWRAIAFRSDTTGEETLALVKGRIDANRPTLVRMHLLSVMHDVFAETSERCGLVENAMRAIAEAGSGVIVLINRFVADYVSRSLIAPSDRRRMDIPRSPELRDYGGGAQILAELGVHDMILLTNTPQSVVALEGYGLSIVEQRPIGRHGAEDSQAQGTDVR